MAIHDALLYRSVDPLVGGGYLPPDELLRRVAARFPLAVIDRERGNQFVRDGVVRLAEVSAHNVVVDDWRMLEDRVSAALGTKCDAFAGCPDVSGIEDEDAADPIVADPP